MARLVNIREKAKGARPPNPSQSRPAISEAGKAQSPMVIWNAPRRLALYDAGESSETKAF